MKLLGLLLAPATVVVVLVLLLAGGGDSGGGERPADAAARLVPADALVYLHLSTDRERPGTERAEALARRFPGYERLRRDLVRRLTAPSCGVRAADLRGDEAALALIDTGATATAGSLVLLDTGEEDAAGARDRSCGALQTTRIGRFVVVGQPQTVQVAKTLARGDGRSLAAAARYRAATEDLPGDRVLDGWVSRDGVRRLLQPQSGLLGAAGTLLDQPALQGAALALTAGEDDARLTVRSALDPRARRTATFRPFTPRRQEDAPAGALAYLGVSGLTTGLQRALDVAGGGFTGLGPLLQRARRQLRREAGAGLERDLLALFRGEVGLTLTPGIPAPTLTVTVATRDAAASRRALRRLEAPLARILAPATGAPSRWARADGIASLRLAAGIELHYAVDDGRVIVATRRDGVEDARDADGRLTGSAPWRSVLPVRPDPLTSLVFLDLSQLLRLAEQTGLNDSRAYRDVRDDLAKVRAVGGRTTAAADETTAEITFSIP